MFFSMDSNFNLIEEVPATHIESDGVALRFNSKDELWNTKMYVYVIVNVYTEQRYYMTTKAKKGNPELSQKLATTILLNAF